MSEAGNLLSALALASIQEKEVRGVKMRIRGMTSAERSAFLEAAAAAKAAGKVDEELTDAAIVSKFVVGSTGVPLLTDREQLRRDLGAALLYEIARECMRASGLDKDDPETIRKNS